MNIIKVRKFVTIVTSVFDKVYMAFLYKLVSMYSKFVEMDGAAT